MTYEELSRGNFIHRQIIDTGNNIRKMQEWIEEMKKDATVVISSYAKPKEWNIVELHGTEVLHLVERRLNELKEHLKKLKTEFASL